MAYFADATDVYAHVGCLIEDLRSDAAVAGPFAALDVVVQCRYRDPEATITLDLRSGGDHAIAFGPTGLDPQIVLTMDADVAHLVLLDELDATIALARGQVTAIGPVELLLAAATASGPTGPRYRAQLAAEGRSDLLAASDADPRAPRAVGAAP
jgi:hypothetical protein